MRPGPIAVPIAVLVAATLAGASGASRPGPSTPAPALRVVSGIVTGAPGPSVSVTLSSEVGESTTVLAGADGSFSFPPVAAGVYLVSPSLPGSGFVPSSRQVTVNGNDVPGLDFAAVPAPRVDGVEPATASPGATVTVRGRGFGPPRPGSSVLLGLERLHVVSWSGELIVARVPRTASGGALRVVASGAASPAVPLAVGPAALASSRTP